MDPYIILKHLSLYLEENKLSEEEFRDRINDPIKKQQIFEELNTKLINFNSTFFSGLKHFESFIQNIRTPFQKELDELLSEDSGLF